MTQFVLRYTQIYSYVFCICPTVSRMKEVLFWLGGTSTPDKRERLRRLALTAEPALPELFHLELPCLTSVPADQESPCGDSCRPAPRYCDPKQLGRAV